MRIVPASTEARPQRSGLVLVAVSVVGAALLVLGLYLVANSLGLVNAANPSPIDLEMLSWAQANRTPVREVLATIITNLADVLPATVIGLVVLLTLYLRYRQRLIVLFVPLASLGAVAISETTKAIVNRSRPPLADAVPPYSPGSAFPSGHTLGNIALTGAVAYMVIWLSPRLRTRLATALLALGWVTAVGMSRVFLGQHWFSDVLSGWLAGLVWLGLLIFAHQLLFVRHQALDADLSVEIPPALSRAH